MARFRKIDPRIWKDEKFLALSPTEKLIAFYCLTAQSNRIGLFNFSPAKASEDLGTLPKTFGEGFQKVCRILKWTFDKTYRVLYLPTWWKYNCPENPNVLKACLNDLHELPQTPLISIFFANIEYLPETFHETFLKGMPKPTPNQEQEQEQEKEQELEQEQEKRPPLTPPTRGNNSLSINSLAEIWNQEAPPELPRVKIPFSRSEKDLKKLQAVIKRHPEMSWWTTIFSQVRSSPFLLGHNDRGWIANFDFVVEKAEKIMDGKYAAGIPKSLSGPVTWLQKKKEAEA